MKFHKNKELLEKLLFLKAIGYNFIDENFLNLSKYQDYSDVDELNNEIKKCSLCFLRNSSKCVATGFGDKNSMILLVAFSIKFDLFESTAGKILQNAINEGLNLEKDNVYISSLLRCEISQNDAKNPALEHSFELCRPYLLEEIRLIKPKIIITLGEEAFMHLYPNLLSKGGFSSIRGSILKDDDRFIMPTFSPEWISKNPSFEENFIDDLRKIKGVI